MNYDEFGLQAGEEALGHRVVVDIARGPYGRAHTHLTAALANGQAGVLGGFNRSSQHLQSGGVYGASLWHCCTTRTRVASQYTREHFQKLLDEQDITCSMSRAGGGLNFAHVGMLRQGGRPVARAGTVTTAMRWTKSKIGMVN